MVTIDDKSTENDGLPPSYSETESAADDPGPAYPSSELPPSFSETSRILRPPLAPPTNYLTIERPNHSIKGTYAIDPTLPVPPGAVVGKGQDGRDLHMRLASQNGAIDAVVDIIRGVDAKGPARLDVESHNGSVSVTIHDLRQNHFRLRVASHNGSVTVRIPPAFIGTVSTRLKNGKLRFSNEIQERLSTFSEVKHEGRFFIGDYAASGYESDETWLMDHIRIEADNGDVKVSFLNDEPFDNFKGKGKGKESGGKGFFGRLLG